MLSRSEAGPIHQWQLSPNIEDGMVCECQPGTVMCEVSHLTPKRPAEHRLLLLLSCRKMCWRMASSSLQIIHYMQTLDRQTKTHLYSNVNCTPTKRHAQAPRINRVPMLARQDIERCTTIETRTCPAAHELTRHTMDPVNAHHETDEVRDHHREDIIICTSCTHTCLYRQRTSCYSRKQSH
jgi:hypothetical protein